MAPARAAREVRAAAPPARIGSSRRTRPLGHPGREEGPRRPAVPQAFARAPPVASVRVAAPSRASVCVSHRARNRNYGRALRFLPPTECSAPAAPLPAPRGRDVWRPVTAALYPCAPSTASLASRVTILASPTGVSLSNTHASPGGGKGGTSLPCPPLPAPTRGAVRGSVPRPCASDAPAHSAVGVGVTCALCSVVDRRIADLLRSRARRRAPTG